MWALGSRILLKQSALKVKFYIDFIHKTMPATCNINTFLFAKDHAAT